MQGFGGGSGTTDQNVTPAILRAIVTLSGTFREAVGEDVDICLDLTFNFKTEGCLRIAKAVEPFNLLWLEIDMYDPDALLQIKQSTTTRICSGENLYTMREYRPYFDRRAMDVAMIDVPWNGFTQAKKVADLAETDEITIAPHNYYSHHSGHARREMREDEFGPITDQEVYEAICPGEAIETYPDDTPYPSVLIFGTTTANRPLHVVCAYDSESDQTVIVTVYQPDPNRWEDFRRRKR